MVRTRVGYAGGAKADPSYYSLGGHSETIQIDYDPSQISYEELLEVFWTSHSPTVRPYSQQYASIIFTHDEEQERLATEAWEREAGRNEGKIYTRIVPYTAFALAEDYHQKYRLRGAPDLMAEFEVIYPDPADFVNSTAVARVNGYVGGYGDLAQLQAEIDGLGLSEAGRETLLTIVNR